MPYLDFQGLGRPVVGIVMGWSSTSPSSRKGPAELKAEGDPPLEPVTMMTQALNESIGKPMATFAASVTALAERLEGNLTGIRQAEEQRRRAGTPSDGPRRREVAGAPSSEQRQRSCSLECGHLLKGAPRPRGIS